MSRHRFVRNIDVHEELEDDVISDEGEDDLSPEDYERMMDGLEQIRAMLGDEPQSALTDDDIKASLYEYYFNVEQAMEDLLEKQGRRFAARERQDPYGKPLPPPPSDDEGDYSWISETSSGRHNVPLVRLTTSDLLSSSEQETTRTSIQFGTLSTITEITERTDDSRDWVPSPHRPPPPLDPYTQPRGSRITLQSSVSTDYGQVIERPSIHPDEVVPSPSPSALQRLSYQERSGSATPTSRRTPSSSSDVTSTPQTYAEVPPIDAIPDIPDLKSKSSLQKPLGPSQASLLSKKSLRTTENTGSDKKSKLSALASSRSSARSSVSSVSARSYITETASDITYPDLRPSAASMVSLIPDKRLPSRPSTISEQSESSTHTSLSRVVQEALQSAMALEDLDREVQREPTTLSIPTSRHPSEWTSTPPTSPSQPVEPLKPMSQLSTGQEPPETTSDAIAPTPRLPDALPPQSASPSTSPDRPRALSKLARLAQAKAQEQNQTTKSKTQATSKPGLILPRSHTEYLVPTANGPTATTAITTSYQSLTSLLSRDQTKLPPSMRYESPPNPRKTSGSSPKPSEPKQSKLAMKSKSARNRAEAEPEIEPEINPVLEAPMFSPQTTRSRASPSAFASLLTNNDRGSPEDGHGDRTHRKHHKSHGERRRHKDRGDAPTDNRPQSKDRAIPPFPPALLPSLRGFAFDVPSPDDIVFNARKGTSLAQRPVSSTASSR
ncbi:hypothetical protein GY45DRAFT_1344655 [Cubamyces sp. BRFM 1775]|nr:hypothetical protein GY45DRAFT_1344655 [Cubamyces sp. BRFM 1775]